MPTFDINQIPEPEKITNYLIFHTPTKAIYDKLMKILETKGWHWKSGAKPTLLDHFSSHIVLMIEKHICYCINGGNCHDCYGPCKGNSHYDILTSNIQLGSPRNNDGRSICYWCSVPTKKRGNGAYDVCPQCGK